MTNNDRRIEKLNFMFSLSNVNGWFLSVYVKDWQPPNKKRKIESYFKDNLGVNGILFLQEIHSISNTATL